MEHLLAGDIGGTKTVLSLYRRDGLAWKEEASARYVSADYSGLAPIVREFLTQAVGASRRLNLRAGAFGVAGPVDSGICKTTNLPWIIDANSLAKTFEAPMELVNDFHAVALGVRELGPEELVTLQEGEVLPRAPIAIVGAGTGLGEAILLEEPDGPRVIASEGGHVDFAPRSPLEVELLRFLWRRHHRVSIERIVSGPGLRALYDFVVETGVVPESPEVRAQIEAGDPGQVIGSHGQGGTDPACVKAVDMFVSAYGAEAGNLALKVLPRGGLFIAGGIAPKLIDKLRDGSFMHAFLDKGRLSSELTRLRVSVVMHPLVGLLGARRLASVLAAR